MEKYRKLKNVGTAGALAVKLAKECFFGEGVLASAQYMEQETNLDYP